MKRSSALATFLGTALIAGVASAAAPPFEDIQAPRSLELQSPRQANEDIQAPRERNEDIQAPRGGNEDIQAPRG